MSIAAAVDSTKAHDPSDPRREKIDSTKGTKKKH
jgi:hypothetical protein